MLTESLRGFLAERLPMDKLRKIAENGLGFDGELWWALSSRASWASWSRRTSGVLRARRRPRHARCGHAGSSTIHVRQRTPLFQGAGSIQSCYRFVSRRQAYARRHHYYARTMPFAGLVRGSRARWAARGSARCRAASKGASGRYWPRNSPSCDRGSLAAWGLRTC